MRSSHLLFSAVQFLFMVLILLLGGFFFGLQYAPHLRLKLAQFFADPSINFIPIGLSVLGCGILLLIGFYAMNRGAYLRFVVRERNTSIETALFRSYVKKYWADQFPDTDTAADVTLYKNNKLEISLQMPPVAVENQELFLENIEKDLRNLLTKTIGYPGDFFLTIKLHTQENSKI